MVVSKVCFWPIETISHTWDWNCLIGWYNIVEFKLIGLIYFSLSGVSTQNVLLTDGIRTIVVVYLAGKKEKRKKKKKRPIVGCGKVAKLLISLSQIEHVLVPFAAGAKTWCLCTWSLLHNLGKMSIISN